VTACQLADASRINSFSASSLATLVQMTAFHRGVTFLPKIAVDKGVGQAESLVIEEIPSDVYREIGMIWRKSTMREQAFLALGNLITELLEK
jgi:LysR family hydrogen peroxide-inducible transcriptional activator